MTAQTNRSFHWIILFDKDSLAELRNRLDARRQTVPVVPYDTGFFDNHGWREAVPFSQIEGRCACLQVVQTNNVSNKIRGYRVRTTHATDLFPDETIGDDFNSEKLDISLRDVGHSPVSMCA